MIPTRWLLLSMVIAVAVIGVLAYWDERRRSEAELADFGREQASVAEAAAIAFAAHPDEPKLLAPLVRPREVRIVLAPPSGPAHLLDGTEVTLPPLTARDRVVRIERDQAPSLGLPARTAMLGFARIDTGPVAGWTVGVVATAREQRDRDRAGLTRLMLSMALATGLVTAFGGLALARQRAQLGLERELAVADTARARDSELERLSRAATMAAVGSGVAHELSTPLGVIVGRAEQLLARANGDERLARNAQAILDEANHIDEVVRGLLGLARGAPIALQETSPRAIVREAASLVEHRFERAGVHLVPAITADAPAVRCEPLLFKHALVNLLLNACDASPRGTTVRVEVRADVSEVAFLVSDEGHGITPEDAARATEPFFTTKPAGQGTGLGLAIVKEIVSTHRGSLAIAPRSPRGTQVTIKLPIEGERHG